MSKREEWLFPLLPTSFPEMNLDNPFFFNPHLWIKRGGKVDKIRWEDRGWDWRAYNRVYVPFYSTINLKKSTLSKKKIIDSFFTGLWELAICKTSCTLCHKQPRIWVSPGIILLILISNPYGKGGRGLPLRKLSKDEEANLPKSTPRPAILEMPHLTFPLPLSSGSYFNLLP